MAYHSNMLHTITHGIANAKPPLLIAHGLFGSGRNWGVIAKRLSDERQVIAVDMRNHGSSLHSDNHSYTALADDLAEVIAAHGGQADVLGHSMGGKAAMVLALEHAEMVNRLTVADIAPVSYSHSQQQYINAMRTLDLSQIEGRAEAQAALLPLVEDPTLASFFTQSLDLKARQWRLNLAALEANMPQILSFPAIDACFTGPSLFLTGATSHYVTRDHRPQIKALFSEARFAKIPEAGHWLHAERPRAFEAAVRTWLNADLS
jgi:pimeloyl-ACP methyl ester carboxylesterase